MLAHRPDFDGGSIVNLMSSLSLGLGGPASAIYPPLRALAPERVAAARQVVVLLIDGLGYRYLQRHGRRLGGRITASLTSVFPSATAPAVTSILTGVGPQQHAVTGWFMHLRELGCVTAMLPFRARWETRSLRDAGLRVDHFVASPPLLSGLTAKSAALNPRLISESAFNIAVGGASKRLAYDELGHCFRAIAKLVRESPDYRYIYAYWPGFDSLSHTHGSESPVAIRHLHEIERGVERLVEQLAGSDTLLLLTADHGFIDVEEGSVIQLEDHPALHQCLALPLTGEPRAAFCHLRPGHEGRFERYVAESLADHFVAHRAADLVAAGIFGLGDPEPRLLQRLGDYVLLPKGRSVLKDTLPTEKPFDQIGVHGGDSEQEMVVPLLAFEC